MLRKLVALADITRDDVVVEIGAGHGDLTRAICERAGFVHSIEIDRSFRDRLASLDHEHDNLMMHFGDFLQMPLSRFAKDKKIKVMGNIPYGITGPILFKIIEERTLVHSAYLTTQKEIGQRVTSASHSRSYGALSAICRLIADVKILMYLKPGIFIPPPKVDSVYFSMVFKEDTLTIERRHIEFIKHCFENKRKYLRHALLKYYDEELVTALYDVMGFASSIRAEEIEPETYMGMFDIVGKLNEQEG